MARYIERLMSRRRINRMRDRTVGFGSHVWSLPTRQPVQLDGAAEPSRPRVSHAQTRIEIEVSP